MDFRKFAIIGVLVLAAFLAMELFFFFVLDNLLLGTLFTGLLYGWSGAVIFALKIDGAAKEQTDLDEPIKQEVAFMQKEGEKKRADHWMGGDRFGGV